MRLLEIPLGLFACLVCQTLLEEVEEFDSLMVEIGKLGLWNTGPARSDIPVHALNEYLHVLVTGIRNMRQATQTGAGLGVVDCCVYEFYLVYTSSYTVQYGMYKYIPVKTTKDVQTKIDAQNRVNDQMMNQLADARDNFPSEKEVNALFNKNIGFSCELIFYLRTGGRFAPQTGVLRGHD